MPSQSVSIVSQGVILLLWLLLSAPLAAHREERVITVVYATGDRIYLNGGLFEGVRVGDEFTVERTGGGVARLKVTDTGDHTAAARLLTAGVHLRPGTAVVGVLSPPIAAGTFHRKTQPEAVAPEDLPALWRHALEDNPPVVVRYVPSSAALPPPLTSRGYAKTDDHVYTYFGQPDTFRNEQRISFWTRVDSERVQGLSFRLRGQVGARYDGRSDTYLPGQRVIPLFREVALLWHPPRRAFFGTLGRFLPLMPQATTIDGVEVGLETDRFTLSAFGGLLPRSLDLVPTVHRQALGGTVSVRGQHRGWAMENREGVWGAVKDGQLFRWAVTVDNHLVRANRFSASQLATVDLRGIDANGDPQNDVALSLLGLDSRYAIREGLDLDFRTRYDETTLFVEDVEDLQAQWVNSLQGVRHLRGEMGLAVGRKNQDKWRPFLFGRGDLDKGNNGGYGGAGVELVDRSVFHSRTGMMMTLDYGIGTGHVADANFSFDTPLFSHRLHLRSGLLTAWQYIRHSSVNTLRHMGFAVLSGRVMGRLELFGNLYVAYDHSLVRATYAPGAWLQAQVGAAYGW